MVQVSQIDEDLSVLMICFNRRDTDSIRRLQSIVGTRVDGRYGSRTARQVEEYREGLIAKRASVLEQIRLIESLNSLVVALKKN